MIATGVHILRGQVDGALVIALGIAVIDELVDAGFGFLVAGSKSGTPIVVFKLVARISNPNLQRPSVYRGIQNLKVISPTKTSRIKAAIILCVFLLVDTSPQLARQSIAKFPIRPVCHIGSSPSTSPSIITTRVVRANEMNKGRLI